MRTLLMTTAALSLLAIAPLHAQTTAPAERGATSPEMDASSSMQSMQAFDSFDARDDFAGQIAGGHDAEALIGADVVNADGESLGAIEDLGIDETGSATHALVDVSGFLELDDHVVAIDLTELSLGEGDAADDEFVFGGTTEQLESMTEFDLDDERWTPESTEM